MIFPARLQCMHYEIGLARDPGSPAPQMITRPKGIGW